MIKSKKSGRRGQSQIKADKEGKLFVTWDGPHGKREMTDVKYERGTITFKNKPEESENAFKMTFEGTVRGDTLTDLQCDVGGEGAQLVCLIARCA